MIAVKVDVLWVQCTMGRHQAINYDMIQNVGGYVDVPFCIITLINMKGHKRIMVFL